MPTVIYKTGSKFHQLFVSNFFKFSLDIYTLSIKSFATKYWNIDEQRILEAA